MRQSAVADPRFVATPVERLLSAGSLGGRRRLIQRDRALDNPTAGRVCRDATGLPVVDRDRNAVSLITSISDVFGSGIIVPGTEIILHNRGLILRWMQPIQIMPLQASACATRSFPP